MSPVQKTGLYYPNKFGLIIIKSLEEVMGRNGLNAILNLAGLNNYIENYPPDSLDKGFDFAELSAIGVALEEMYGPRGGRGLALRAGRATFSDAANTRSGIAAVAEPGRLRGGARIGGQWELQMPRHEPIRVTIGYSPKRQSNDEVSEVCVDTCVPLAPARGRRAAAAETDGAAAVSLPRVRLAPVARRGVSRVHERRRS